MTVPVPHLVRIEYLGKSGWVLGHAAINLLDPGRYVERLEDHGKFGRATDTVSGRVWVSPNTPKDPSVLVDATNNHMPCLPDSSFAKKAPPRCPYCQEPHAKPFDGGCLI